MYFLRIKPLKEDLAGRGLDEKERYKYVLGWMIAMVLSMRSGIQADGTVKSFLVLACLLITILGVRYAYRQNGGEAGAALLDRFSSIGFVMYVRVMLALVVLSAVVMGIPMLRQLLELVSSSSAFLFQSQIQADEPEGLGETAVFALMTVAAYAYFLFTVGKHIGDVRRAADPLAGRGAGTVPGTGIAMTLGIPLSNAAGIASAPDAVDNRLEKFVETVVRREVSAARASRKAETVRPTPRQPVKLYRKPARMAGRIRTISSLRKRRPQKKSGPA